METPSEHQEDKSATGEPQMEMMFGLAGLMMMMMTSLALQHSLYRRRQAVATK